METADLVPDADADEHDPFGGATPVGEDQDITWRPQRPARRPPWFWIGTAVLAVALGTGAFVGMRSAANNANNANTPGNIQTTPGNGFPPGPGRQPRFGPPGGPRFGPPPDQQQQQPQQQSRQQQQQNVITQ